MRRLSGRWSVPCIRAMAVALVATSVWAGPADPSPASAAESDAYLQGYVESWLLLAQRLGPDRVAVAVRDGVVTLEGTADSPEQMDAVMAAVSSFARVEQVINPLEVGPTRGAHQPPAHRPVP